jgi:hypothetical protein
VGLPLTLTLFDLRVGEEEEVPLVLGLLAVLAAVCPAVAPADEIVSAEKLFRRDNLVAWCIVPFDDEARSPADRGQRAGLHLQRHWRVICGPSGPDRSMHVLDRKN